MAGAWKNTNLYYFTPEIQYLCDKAAQGTPQWKGVGSKLEHRMWKIEQMAVFKADMSGKLFTGDSYICLHVYEYPDDAYRRYDIHFWIGTESTEDEYGAAMYKSAELDRKLRERGLVGAMHREVQEFESELFLSYFPKGLHYMLGGTDGVNLKGMQKEDAEKDDDDEGEYAIRLFQVKGRGKHVMLSQVPTARAAMNSGDVFVLDAHAAVYQWNGKDCNDDERARGALFAANLAAETEPPRDVLVLSDGVDDSEEDAEDFWSNFPSLEDAKLLGLKLRDTTIKTAEEGGDDAEVADRIPSLYRLRETFGGFASGPFVFVSGQNPTKPGALDASALLGKALSKVGLGDEARKPAWEDLTSTGIYLVDYGFGVSLWLGSRSSQDLAQKIFPFAMLFIKRMKKAPIINIHVYRENHESQGFKDLFGPPPPPQMLKLHERIITAIKATWLARKVSEKVDPKIVVLQEKAAAKRRSQLGDMEEEEAYPSFVVGAAKTETMTKTKASRSTSMSSTSSVVVKVAAGDDVADVADRV